MLLEDKGKNFIFLRLPEKCVSELNLTCDQEFHAEVKINVNFCRWTLRCFSNLPHLVKTLLSCSSFGNSYPI